MIVFDTKLSESLDRIRKHQDGLFLFGAAANLYAEAMRRQADRILYGPQDIENLLKIVDVLLNIKGIGHIPASRTADPTEEEVSQVNDPFTQIDDAVTALEARSQK